MAWCTHRNAAETRSRYFAPRGPADSGKAARKRQMLQLLLALAVTRSKSQLSFALRYNGTVSRWDSERENVWRE